MPTQTIATLAGTRQMATNEESTALAHRVAEGAIELVSPASFNRYIADIQARAHVLSPVTQIGSLPPMWKIVPAIVYANPDPVAGEVYQDRLFCKDGEVAPTKVLLRRIAQAGGMDTGATRLDDGHIQYFWSFQGYIKYRGFDGQKKVHTASVEWDLREGSELVNRMVKAAERNRKQNDKRDARTIAAQQIDAARLNGYRNAEARATNAAIREFGLRQKYTQAELEKKPFVVFNMVASPDMNDPEQRRMVLQHALGGEAALGYPPAAALPAPPEAPPANHATGDIIDTTTGEIREKEPQTQSGGDQPYEASKPAASDGDETYLITGVFRNGDKVYCKTDKTGDTPLFIEQIPIADAAKAAMSGNRRVALVIEKRGGDRFVTELTEPY